MNIKLAEVDFRYKEIIDYNYDNLTDCANSGCDDEGICRCGTIINTITYNFDIYKLVEYIVDNLHIVRGKKLSEIFDITVIDKYCIDRVLRHHRIWDLWEVRVSGGYYGEEIDGVMIEEYAAKRIETDLYAVLSMKNNIDKIFYVLNLEYKRIHPKISNTTVVEVDIVDKNDIIVSSENRLSTLDALKAQEIYQNHNLPRCICYKTGGKYIVIDGHNRYSANPLDIYEVIVLK